MTMNKTVKKEYTEYTIDLEGSSYTHLRFKREADKQDLLQGLQEIIPSMLGMVNRESLPVDGRICFHPYIEDGKLTFHLGQYGLAGNCHNGLYWRLADQVVKTPYPVKTEEWLSPTVEYDYWGGDFATHTDYIVG